MRVLVTGGGTGGHVYPGIAIAKRLIQSHPEAEIVFTGSATGPEAKAAGDAGFSFIGLNLAGLVGRRPLEMLRALSLFAGGTIFCRKMLKEKRPLCVVGTGGYAAAPACFAAFTLKIPLIMHEMNYRPGLVTRVLARRACAVAVAYPGTRRLLPRGTNAVLTGVPVRPEVEALRDEETAAGSRALALVEFGLVKERKTLLVFGGSQGSEALNGAVWEVVPRMSERGDIQVLHLSGKRGYEDARREEAERKVSRAALIYRVREYSERVDLAYAVSDLAVTRAGASTIAELAAAAVPSVLVPFPFATGGHQEENAEQLGKTGLARVVRQDGASAARALEEAMKLLDDEKTLRDMREAGLRAGTTSGAKGIVELVEELSEGKGTARHRV